MSKIVKITLTSESGFCPIDYVYKDKLEITESSIKYCYMPEYLVKNKPIKWSYKSDSEQFKNIFNEICKSFELISQDIQSLILDGGTFTTSIQMEDGTKETYISLQTHANYDQFIETVRKIIPKFEKIPEVLILDSDYDEDGNL